MRTFLSRWRWQPDTWGMQPVRAGGGRLRLSSIFVYNGEFWAVSQAAPMRRVHIIGPATLMDYCTSPSYASGGFIADSQFDGGILNVVNNTGGSSTSANPDTPVTVVSYP